MIIATGVHCDIIFMLRNVTLAWKFLLRFHNNNVSLRTFYGKKYTQLMRIRKRFHSRLPSLVAHGVKHNVNQVLINSTVVFFLFFLII